MTAARTPWDLIVCPNCRGALSAAGDKARCGACGRSYPAREGSGLDLRLASPKTVSVKFEVGTTLFSDAAPDFTPLSPNPKPEVDFREFPLPPHLPIEMASHLPKARRQGAVCLDLGCGDGEYRAAIEHAGYRWLGADYAHPQAPILADGHALPFAAASFDLVVSLAVLEHIRFPHLFTEEVYRVLRPGGIFFGSVTYLTPFHQESFYNMTHYGAFSVLKHAGFRVRRIAADRKYLGPRAMAYDALFPGAGRRIAYALASPLVAVHKLWWSLGRRLRPKRFDPTTQYLLSTAAFVFIAERPAT